MRKKRLAGLAGIALAGVLAGSALIGAAPSQAKPGDPVLGELAISPATGDFNTLLSYTTEGACPEGAVRAYSRLIGPGFSAANGFPDGYTALFDTYTSPPGPVPVTAGAFSKGLQNTLGYINQNVATLDGDYELRVTCARPALGPQTPALGDYVTHLRFSAASSTYEWLSTPTTTTTTTSTTTTTVAPSTKGTVAGTVTDGSGPVAGAVVRLYAEDGVLAHSQLTTGDGSYSLAGVEAGSYRVYVLDPSGQAFNQWWDHASTFGGSTAVVVVAGETTDVSPVLVAKATKGALAGTVTAGGGEAVAGATVRLYGQDATVRAAATTGADGTYRFADVEAGTYKVYVLVPGAAGYYSQWFDHATSLATSTPVEVLAGETTGVNPVLVAKASKGSVSGSVTSSGGGAAVGTTVRLYDAGATLRSAKVVGADGSFTFTDLAPGTYKVYVLDGSGTYRNQWFDRAVSFGTAAPVVVIAGGDTAVDPVVDPLG